jgi:hypothetical protein
MAVGQSTITAALAPASYFPPQSQQATLVGNSTSLDLGALVPKRWIAQGATVDVPLTTQALNAGAPQANVVVNYTLTSGTATLSAGSATTNGSGYATINAHITNQTTDVLVSACVAPNNAPCRTFTLLSTPATAWTLEPVAGTDQVVLAGQSFQPLFMRVTDGASIANPVLGAGVVFNTMIVRLPPGSNGQNGGESFVGETGTPVIMGTTKTTVVTNQDGLASIMPGPGSIHGACDLLISVGAGPSTAQIHLRILAAVGNGQQAGPHGRAPRYLHLLPISPSAMVEDRQLFAVPEVIGTEPSAEPAPPADATSESDQLIMEAAAPSPAECERDKNVAQDCQKDPGEKKCCADAKEMPVNPRECVEYKFDKP